MEQLRRITMGAKQNPIELNPDMPEDVRAIIEKATSTNRAERYQDCGELIADIDTALEQRGEKPWRMGKRGWGAVVAGSALLAVAVAVVATRDGKEEKVPIEPPPIVEVIETPAQMWKAWEKSYTQAQAVHETRQHPDAFGGLGPDELVTKIPEPGQVRDMLMGTPWDRFNLDGKSGWKMIYDEAAGEDKDVKFNPLLVMLMMEMKGGYMTQEEPLTEKQLEYWLIKDPKAKGFQKQVARFCDYVRELLKQLDECKSNVRMFEGDGTGRQSMRRFPLDTEGGRKPALPFMLLRLFERYKTGRYPEKDIQHALKTWNMFVRVYGGTCVLERVERPKPPEKKKPAAKKAAARPPQIRERLLAKGRKRTKRETGGAMDGIRPRGYHPRV